MSSEVRFKKNKMDLKSITFDTAYYATASAAKLATKFVTTLTILNAVFSVADTLFTWKKGNPTKKATEKMIEEIKSSKEELLNFVMHC